MGGEWDVRISDSVKLLCVLPMPAKPLIMDGPAEGV